MSRDNSADPFHTDAATLSHYSDSRDNANRLMDDLELLRVERQVSNAEKEKENASRGRSRSQHHQDRHKPEAPPEDAFHTLTEPAQLPQISGGPEPTALRKLFKKLRRFPRVVRYFLYVCPSYLVLPCCASVPQNRLLLYYPILTPALQRLYQWRSFS